MGMEPTFCTAGHPRFGLNPGGPHPSIRISALALVAALAAAPASAATCPLSVENGRVVVRADVGGTYQFQRRGLLNSFMEVNAAFFLASRCCLPFPKARSGTMYKP